MKLTHRLLSRFLLVIFIFSELFALAQNPAGIVEKSLRFSLEFAPKQNINTNSYATNPKIMSGSMGYGNNVWTNQLYRFEYAETLSTTVIAHYWGQSASGDFYPNDFEHFYLLDINDNYLRKINVSDALTIDSVFLAMPIPGGIWTVFSIHKTSGEYYAVATDATQSVIYQIDAATGLVSPVFSTGLSAVISGTFDDGDMLWLFEIENDNIYKFNISTLDFQLVGSAGFDGDSPQGMGYDSLEDHIYLAAFEKNVGPQLRLLNTTTGASAFLTNLPGETTAFGFPFGTPPIGHTIVIPAGWSGISSFVNPNDPVVANILSVLGDDFILIENNAGEVYWPQQNITSLQTWNPSQGYIINMAQTATLTITGTPIENLTLNLNTGWNTLAVFVPDEYPIDQLFANAEGFVMAKEIAGTGIYWPQHQINTLSTLMPGKAYYIYTTQNISVTFQPAFQGK